MVYRKVIFVNNRLASNVAYDDKSSGYTSELPNEGVIAKFAVVHSDISYI